MTEQPDGGIWHPDLDNEEDMAILVRSGLIWKGGSVGIQKAVDYLLEHPEDINDYVPEELLPALGR